jgi:hypothetical protein
MGGTSANLDKAIEVLAVSQEMQFRFGARYRVTAIAAGESWSPSRMALLASRRQNHPRF